MEDKKRIISKKQLIQLQTRPGGVHLFARWLYDINPGVPAEFGAIFSRVKAAAGNSLTQDDTAWENFIVTHINSQLEVFYPTYLLRVDFDEYFQLSDHFLNTEIELTEKILNELIASFTSIDEYRGGFQQFLGWVYFSYRDNYYYLTKSYVDDMLDEEWVSRMVGIEDYKKRADELIELMSEYSYQVMSQNSIVFNADNIPEELLTSFQQYFLFFNEYIEAVKGEKVNLQVRQTHEGLQFMFKAVDSERIEEVKSYLNEFFSLARRVIIAREPIEEVLEQLKINEFKKIQLEAQVNHLQLNLKLKETEIKYLTKENDFLKTLALNFTENSQAIITNQFISDGQQQFGTTIQNLKPPKKDQPED